MLAYILSSLYITEYNIDNVLKLYVGIVLYNRKLLFNISNKDLNQDFFDLIENNILKHFKIIKDIFSSIKKEIKNISIPEVPIEEKIFKINDNSNIKENELCFQTGSFEDNENMKTKKLYSEIIEKKLGYNIVDINKSLKTFNIKIEYLNEIIRIYKSYHNIETINLLEDFESINE